MSHRIQNQYFRHAYSPASPLGRLTACGFQAASLGVQQWRTYREYALVYVLSGKGFMDDEQGFHAEIEAGDLMFIYPDIAHRYGPKNNAVWSEIYISFSGPVFDLWQTQGLLDSKRPLRHLEPIAEWQRRFESILGAPRRNGYAPALTEVCRLQDLLADILLDQGPKLGAQQHWLDCAIALLEADLSGELDMNDIAKNLGMNYETFRKRFTQLTQEPPARYRLVRRIERACDLMRAGVATDCEVSDMLGFCDASYFSRCFRRITGNSPSTFRKLIPRRQELVT